MKRITKTDSSKKDKVSSGKKSAVETKAGKEPDSEFKANFRAVIDNAGIGIAVVSPKGKILIVNSALSKILGYSKKEFLELTLTQITHPHDLESVRKLFRDVVGGKRNRYQTEKRYITKDGSVKFAKLTISIIDDKKIDSKNIIVLVEDITDQKQVLDTLQKEQNLFTKLLELMPDYIYFKDLNSRFLKVNRACALKHGFASPELMIGKTDKDSFGLEHSSETYLDEQQIIQTGIPLIGKEEKEDWPDGKTTWALTTKMPLYDNKKNIIGTFGITRDITQNKLIQQSLKE
ncbi:MAG: PAS domain S-box protein, partial [Melioribacteraceae bacterium]